MQSKSLELNWRKNPHMLSSERIDFYEPFNKGLRYEDKHKLFQQCQ